jgi:hypothetical protein
MFITFRCIQIIIKFLELRNRDGDLKSLLARKHWRPDREREDVIKINTNKQNIIVRTRFVGMRIDSGE